MGGVGRSRPSSAEGRRVGRKLGVENVGPWGPGYHVTDPPKSMHHLSWSKPPWLHRADSSPNLGGWLLDLHGKDPLHPAAARKENEHILDE